MTIDIKVPPLPESVTDATLVGWHKKIGEAVTRDENLVDLETDKVVLEVPAPSSGTLVKIVAESGATVTAGDLLSVLGQGEGATGAASGAKPEPPARNTAHAGARKGRGPRQTIPRVRRFFQ